jgi:hypothetical protein
MTDTTESTLAASQRPPANVLYERPEPGVLRAIAESIDAPERQIAADRDPTLPLYRDRTAALLRRYMQISIEVGRMPSLLGREFFRTRVTSYRASSFVDAVIFVLDIEHSLEKITDVAKSLIGMIVLQEYSQEEAAVILNRCRRTINHDYGEALDEVTEVFLQRGILERMPQRFPKREKPCQGGSEPDFAVCHSNETE